MISYRTLNSALGAMIFGLAAFGSTAAQADGHSQALSERLASGGSALTRAEVLADLKIYQESGLASEERVYSDTGVETAALEKARARYLELRKGERYTALVAQISRRTGEIIYRGHGA